MDDSEVTTGTNGQVPGQKNLHGIQMPLQTMAGKGGVSTFAPAGGEFGLLIQVGMGIKYLIGEKVGENSNCLTIYLFQNNRIHTDSILICF